MKRTGRAGADNSLVAEELLPKNDGASESPLRHEPTLRPRLPTHESVPQITPSMHTASLHTHDTEDSDNESTRYACARAFPLTDGTLRGVRALSPSNAAMASRDKVVLRTSSLTDVSSAPHGAFLRPRPVTSNSKNFNAKRSLSSDAVVDRWQTNACQCGPSRDRPLQSRARSVFLRDNQASTVLDFRDDVINGNRLGENDWGGLHDRPNSPPEAIRFPRCESLKTNVIEKLESKMDTGNSLAALRTTLSNERTFLAWIRTAAALIACGLAIDKALENERAVAAIFIVTGFFTGIQGVIRFYQVRKRLDTLVFRSEGRMDIGRVGMKWFVLFVVVTISISVAYLAVRLMMLPRPKDDA